MNDKAKFAAFGGAYALVAAAFVYTINPPTVAEEPAQPTTVQEHVFVCTDKYGTSQERFGVKSADRYDQMWHVKFADGQVGHYLQVHGEWCYILPVEEVKEEK